MQSHLPEKYKKKLRKPGDNSSGNLVNTVTVKAEPIVSTSNIHVTPHYSDLSTVIYVWGDNPGRSDESSGSSASEYWTPTIYRNLSDVKITCVCCSESHMLFLTEQKLIYTLGNGDYGQLGLGKGIIHVSEPTFVSKISDVKQICCGKFHSVALVEGGSLFSWGRNDFSGHLNGFATFSPKEILTNKESSPGVKIVCNCVSSSDLQTIAVCDEGRCLYFWGIAFNGERIRHPRLFFSFSSERICQIAVGTSFALALSERGIVFNYGDGTYGEIYSESTITNSTPIFSRIKHNLIKNITQIAVGSRHALLIDDNNNVLAFGDNNYGQCGAPQRHHTAPVIVEFTEANFLPKYVYTGNRTSACINSGNQLFLWGHSSNHKLIFTSSVDILIQQQKQPGVSIISGYKNSVNQLNVCSNGYCDFK
ncbi:uncharacterized protein TA06735 [Theileria annulata]|uniref:RCC1-like domain-containing protein n=1 Tax=Theileria annulata TaxID=5874 RepID=Q4UHR8_THEAN|nr:uncharacterized protein TA06735 [Theileria annulata]CAI73371.1 hypothetical protein, conserved [Theileria annulata]|eukprot:XP_954048.1 hypothetical protein, conserved [Theileria annulata]